ERTPFEIQADEMDYLGFYLFQGMYFDIAKVKGMNHVGLSGMSNDIDRWVFERFELCREVAPPHSPMPDRFSDFLRDLEATASDFRTDCAISLLDLGAKARGQVRA